MVHAARTVHEAAAPGSGTPLWRSGGPRQPANAQAAAAARVSAGLHRNTVSRMPACSTLVGQQLALRSHLHIEVTYVVLDGGVERFLRRHVCYQ